MAKLYFNKAIVYEDEAMETRRTDERTTATRRRTSCRGRHSATSTARRSNTATNWLNRRISGSLIVVARTSALLTLIKFSAPRQTHSRRVRLRLITPFCVYICLSVDLNNISTRHPVSSQNFTDWMFTLYSETYTTTVNPSTCIKKPDPAYNRIRPDNVYRTSGP